MIAAVDVLLDFQVKTPFGFGSQRDMCQRWETKVLDSSIGLWAVLIVDEESQEAEPLPKGWIRIKTLVGGYLIRSVNSAKGCEMVSVNQSVVGGCIPTRISTAFAAKAPLEWQKKLHRHCLNQMKVMKQE
jgi:hypothetical protein